MPQKHIRMHENAYKHMKGNRMTTKTWQYYEKHGYSMKRHETSWNTRLNVHYCVMKIHENPQDTTIGGFNTSKHVSSREHRQNIKRCCEIAQKHMKTQENALKALIKASHRFQHGITHDDIRTYLKVCGYTEHHESDALYTALHEKLLETVKDTETYQLTQKGMKYHEKHDTDTTALKPVKCHINALHDMTCVKQHNMPPICIKST